MTESEILYNNFMNVSKCMERLQFLSMRDDELDNNLKKMKPFQEKSSKKAFTIIAILGVVLAFVVIPILWVIIMFVYTPIFYPLHMIFGSDNRLFVLNYNILFFTFIPLGIIIYFIAFTIVVMIVNSSYKNYNKNGAANLEKKKNEMLAEQEKNKQEALDIYKEIREYLKDHVPQEYRNGEDLRNLAQYFKKYDLMSIPDAIALYEKDIKAGVYDKK